jgi:hypothetical protein
MRPTSQACALLIAASVLFVSPRVTQAQLIDDAVPEHALIVKGAWSGASSHAMPLPEGGAFIAGRYHNDYFGLDYYISAQWTQRFEGPPPSDSGYYVLAQPEPANEPDGAISAHLLIAAQDLFFASMPNEDAPEHVRYARDRLPSSYVIDTEPTEVNIAGHSFIQFDYSSRVSGLHWRVLATQMRCHVVQFVFTSRDQSLISVFSGTMQQMKFSPRPTPVCIRDYANGANRIAGENPMLGGARFNPIPVRITIDAAGRVKQIHYLSAFPEQSAAISQALARWRFKPYRVDGRPREVETGIMFGNGGSVAVSRR